MFDFLKTCVLGLLYLILSPFILAFVALYAVFSLFVFIYMFFKRVVLFFSGEDMKEGMKIDRLARLHIQNQDEEKEKTSSEVTPVIEKNVTAVVQPIIIQTDQNGVLKSVQIAPTSAPEIASSEPIFDEEGGEEK